MEGKREKEGNSRTRKGELELGTALVVEAKVEGHLRHVRLWDGLVAQHQHIAEPAERCRTRTEGVREQRKENKKWAASSLTCLAEAPQKVLPLTIAGHHDNSDVVRSAGTKSTRDGLSN